MHREGRVTRWYCWGRIFTWEKVIQINIPMSNVSHCIVSHSLTRRGNSFALDSDIQQIPSLETVSSLSVMVTWHGVL